MSAAITQQREAPPRIGDHGFVGDGRSAALVDGRGGVVWLAWPRFDSDPVFAALLDPSRGGVFRVAPVDAPCPESARYLDDTNVIETTFASATLLDLMTVDADGARDVSLAPEHELLRVVRAQTDVTIRIELDPRPRFATKRARLHVGRGGRVHFEDGAALYALQASRTLAWTSRPDGGLQALVELRGGEQLGLSFSFALEHPAVLAPPSFDAAVDATLAFWRTWAARARYEGPHRAAIVRSALALKLMCYAPSGAIIAAPTTSLPELRGGDRNWDYRFCWLRDAAFTARAFFGLGYEAEAEAFVDWSLHATRLTRPALRIFYDVFGELPAGEREIRGLSGYGGARPIRVGNAAADQVQLDVYGEVIDAVAQSCRTGRVPDVDTQQMILELAAYVADHWREPDEGIWEPREARTHHVHSRVLCWVALDRVLEHGEILGLPSRLRESFETERASIAEEVRARGFSRELGSYVSTLDGSGLDASLLLLSWYGFEDASSVRMRGTARTIDRVLGVGDSLLRRNLDLPDDGGFVACSFWAVDHLARGGGTREVASARFSALVRQASPFGLYGEILEPGTHEQLGNYPQGFSHLALVNAALSLREASR